MFSKHLGWQTERGREWKPWKGQRRQSSVLIMSRSFIHRPDIAWRMKGRKTKSFSEAWVMLIVQTSSYLLFLLVCFTWSGFGTRLSQGLFLRYWRSSHLNGHMLGKHPTTYTYFFPFGAGGPACRVKWLYFEAGSPRVAQSGPELPALLPGAYRVAITPTVIAAVSSQTSSSGGLYTN